MTELEKILKQDFYRPDAPEGHRCLTSCKWLIKVDPGDNYMVLPSAFVPAFHLTAEQAIAELQDVVDRDKQARPADHPGGHPLHQQGRELLKRLEKGEGLRSAKKYLADRREHYPSFRAFWDPPRDGINRPGWGPGE